MAGFTPVFASEFVEAARETYEANNPGVPVDPRDIRELAAEEVLSAINMRAGELDVLEGSPPCSGFSMSGKRAAGWGKVKTYSDTRQRVDDLFFEFIRLLEGIKPKAFVAENVPALATGAAKGYLKEILTAARGAGYNVECAVLSSARFGVPQNRSRLIFIGIRNDIGARPAFPEGEAISRTLRDAIGDLADPGPSSELAKGTKLRWVYERSRPGESFDKSLTRREGRPVPKYFNHHRCHWDAPVPTVVASCAGLYHPDEPRTLGIQELKRVSSFPDDFQVTGSFAKQWERIGRSVPPLMMKAIAEEVDKLLAAAGV